MTVNGTLLRSTVTPLTASTGVTVTASATPHAKGAWVDLITAAANLYGGDLLSLLVSDNFITATDTSMAIDIGIGAAGSEVVRIEGILAGYAGSQVGSGQPGGRNYIFPLYVPAGVRVAVRAQALIVSDTVVVTAHMMGGSPWGDPSRYPRGLWTTYGFNAGTTKGVVPTAGSVNVKGAWTEVVATTTRDHRYFFPSFHGADAAIIAVGAFLDIGVGAAAAETVIIPDIGIAVAANESIAGPFPAFMPLLRPVPAGSRLAVRTQASTTSVTDLSIVVHAI